MKCTNFISKYDIHWQIQRMRLKRYATHQEKCKAASNYLMGHKNIADKERVTNYLVGLSMAYQSTSRAHILKVKELLSTLIVMDTNECSKEYGQYEVMELIELTKDLITRVNKWLKKGYRNKELIDFIIELTTHTKDFKRQQKLQKAVQESYAIDNTHKFFF